MYDQEIKRFEIGWHGAGGMEQVAEDRKDCTRMAEETAVSKA